MSSGLSKKFRAGTVLSCQLTLGERVFGRCNWARTKDGNTHPVCLELRSSGETLGLERKDSGGDTSARLRNAFKAVPVDRYE